MKKLLFQGLLLIAFFAGLWFLLRQVDWVKLLHLEKISEKTEKKLGDLFWDAFSQNEKLLTEKDITVGLDSLVTVICRSNGMDRSKIKVHVFEKTDVNAFALPDGHLVVNSGLIKECRNIEELAGVLGHELAHIQLNHVMKKLGKDIGISVLISMATGTDGTILSEAIKTLTGSAFDRELEKDADIRSVDYLSKAGLDPNPMADFMGRLAEKEGDAAQYFTWVSSHPPSKERVEYIREYARTKTWDKSGTISPDIWKKMKAAAEK